MPTVSFIWIQVMIILIRVEGNVLFNMFKYTTHTDYTTDMILVNKTHTFVYPP